VSQPPIHLAFLWHMHQPWYVDPATDEALLPWVRLHATAAYSDMACLLARHPTIRATVSISPSLLDQIQRYVDGGGDLYERMTLIPAEELSPDDAQFLLRHFFSVNWGRVLSAMPRYRELLEKRGRDVSGTRWAELATAFSAGELRDIQVLFNLSWFGECAVEKETVNRLLAKGGGFTEQDKQAVLRQQREVIAGLLPRWTELVAGGAVEIAATPYYHAILPLLVDTNTAKRANPEVKLPERYSFPRDASAQIARSMDRLEQVFARRPRGIWPSEAAVSPEAVELARGCGLRYVVTDSELLFHSLDDRGGTPGRNRLYQPYSIGDVAVLFRDDQLSVRIARDYASWSDSEAAARDFVENVVRAGERARVDGDAPPLVLVALDGENPWEAYPRRGHDFLDALYRMLGAHERIRTVTLTEHLEQHPPPVGLDYLSSGSWIEANFDIWIGDAEKNRAWNLLGRARSKLEREQLAATHGPDQLRSAEEHLLRAECSDWFWWLGEPFHSAEDPIYESLFRGQLLAFYQALGDSPPADLSRPIPRGGVVMPLRQPTALISPRIDGTRTSYFEWRGAGFYRVPSAGAARNGVISLIAGLYWGFDPGRIYLRLDPTDTHLEGPLALSELDVSLELTAPGRTIVGRLELDGSPALQLTARSSEGDDDLGRVKEVAFVDVLELAIPLSRLGFPEGARLGLTFSIRRGAEPLQEVPHRGVIEIEIPGDELGE